jgi:hypothetical protein
VRGLEKAGIEASWVSLTYNVARWIRVRSAVAIIA